METAISTLVCWVDITSWDGYSRQEVMALGQLYLPYLILGEWSKPLRWSRCANAYDSYPHGCGYVSATQEWHPAQLQTKSPIDTSFRRANPSFYKSRFSHLSWYETCFPASLTAKISRFRSITDFRLGFLSDLQLPEFKRGNPGLDRFFPNLGPSLCQYPNRFRIVTGILVPIQSRCYQNVYR